MKLLAVLVIVLAVACGDDKAESPKASPTADPPPGPAPTPEPIKEAPPPPPPPPPQAVKLTTPELEALDKTLASILAMTDKEAQSAAACKAVDVITTQMRAVDRNPPAGVDPVAWTEIAERMSGGMNDFAIECAEDGGGNIKALTDAVETAKEFEALLAKKAN